MRRVIRLINKIIRIVLRRSKLNVLEKYIIYILLIYGSMDIKSLVNLLSEELNITSRDVYRHIYRLKEKGYVRLNGNTVKLREYVVLSQL